MRKTLSLMKLNKLWQNLHPPLPRTPRQSQQLLDALTASFRRQLDREFPPPSPASQSIENPDSSVYAADQHLSAILENPLFQSGTAFPPVSTASGDAKVSKDDRPKVKLVAALDELLASGSVTRHGLIACLNDQLLLMHGLKNVSTLKEMMKESKAGSKVVTWFWSSDSAARKMVLKSRQIHAALLRFMAAESLQDTTMLWIKMVLEGDVGGQDGQIAVEDARNILANLLANFMKAELRYGGGLNSALRFYLQTYSTYTSLDQQLGRELQMSLVQGGIPLFRWISEHVHGQDESISVPLYDDFRDAVFQILSPRSLYTAIVALCHPIRPDPQPLLQLIKELSSEDQYQFWTANNLELLFRNSCDALLILVVNERYKDASVLAQFSLHVLRSISAKTHSLRDEPSSESLISELDSLDRLVPAPE